MGATAANGRNGSPCALLGNDTDIDLATDHPEFDAWKWIPPEQLPEMIVPFKRQLYIDILAEFQVVLRRCERALSATSEA